MKKNPFAGVRGTIREMEFNISKNIVRRRFDVAGLCSYRAAKKPFILAKNTLGALKHGGWHDELGVLFRIIWIGTILSHKRYNGQIHI